MGSRGICLDLSDIVNVAEEPAYLREILDSRNLKKYGEQVIIVSVLSLSSKDHECCNMRRQ